MLLNIQMLRALAALLVVLHHLGPHYEHAGGASELLISLAQWGFVGVDIFFVISGFVISYTIFSRQRDVAMAGKYWRHRLSRIYLGYWPFALLALFVFPLHSPDQMQNVSTLRTLTLTSADLGVLALPVAWSLAYELYFYAIFGALFLLSDTLIRRILLVLFVALLLRVLFIDMDQNSNGYFWVSAYILEFMYGVLIFLYREQLTSRKLILPAVILVVLGFVLVGDNFTDHDHRVWYLGISAAALFLLALQLEDHKIFTAPRWLVSLGDSSYALYLSHWFVITAFFRWGWRDALAAQSGWLVEIGFSALLMFIVLLAHFWYRRFERPLYLKAIGREPKSRSQPNPARE